MNLDFKIQGNSNRKIFGGSFPLVMLRYFLLSFLLASSSISYAQTLWLGTESSDWFETQNWSNGIPMSGNNAAIPTSPSGDFLPTINQEITIDFTIENANILTFFGDVINNSTIINYEDGSILNYGELTNQLVIDNDGELYSAGNIVNNGEFDNSGTLQFDFGDEFINTTDGRFYNYGPVKLIDTHFSNMGVLYINGGEFETSGEFENFGIIQNNGILKNLECGIFKNIGDINNTFIIENHNLFYNEGNLSGNPVADFLSLQNTPGITSANHQCIDKDGWTHFSETADSKILLSIFTDTADIGNVFDQSLIIQVNNDNRLGSGEANNLSDALYPNCDDWYTLNRSWVIKSSISNNSSFKVRFYYDPIDFNDIKNTFPLTQNIQELVFYKLNGTENAYDPNILSSETNLFDLANLSSSASWSQNEVTFSEFAEIETLELNGAYSAGVKSWLGGTIPFQLSFKAVPNAQTEKVTIEWSTSLENESLEYVLQKSDDGISFIDFKTIAANNTNNLSVYEQIDEQPNLQMPTFYRLKLLRTDGNIRYSIIKEVNFDSGEISIFPNPSVDELYIRLSGIEEGEITVNIYDINGKMHSSCILEVIDGITIENLYGKMEIGAGVYSLQVLGIDKNETYRFIKVLR